MAVNQVLAGLLLDLRNAHDDHVHAAIEHEMSKRVLAAAEKNVWDRESALARWVQQHFEELEAVK